jgi:hypothetical protein
MIGRPLETTKTAATREGDGGSMRSARLDAGVDSVEVV